MTHDERASAFAAELWEWFSRRKRELPWRDLKIADDTQRAYMILVSEVMLQQTQVSRVIVIFRNFLERFPTLNDLAAAGNKDVILAWKGMGYNSRALRLRDAAKTVVEQYGGRFPKEMSELLAIKGIGSYTAAAIRNFAFGIPTPCVDTNIHRILHRVFESPEPEKINTATARKVLGYADDALKIALQIGDRRNRRDRGSRGGDIKNSSVSSESSASSVSSTKDWHAALMDFGSLTCKKINPLCAECPMSRGICKSAFKVVKVAKVKAVEPGRQVGAKFIPNRIFRGRVVDVLREHPGGLSAEQIGPLVAPDWNPDLAPWLEGLIAKLVADHLLSAKEGVYALRD